MNKEDKIRKRLGLTKIILMEDGIIKSDTNLNSHQQEIVKLDLRGYIMRPVDQKVFAKTKQEKIKVKSTKNTHNRILRKHGLDPKKYMNLPLIY